VMCVCARACVYTHTHIYIYKEKLVFMLCLQVKEKLLVRFIALQ